MQLASRNDVAKTKAETGLQGSEQEAGERSKGIVGGELRAVCLPVCSLVSSRPVDYHLYQTLQGGVYVLTR